MFIYCIKNIENGMSYIGQTRSKAARIAHHKTALKNNRHKNIYLQRAYNKYGSDCFSFDIIECLILKTQDYLNEREQWWIDNTVSLYNIRKSAADMIYPNCHLNNPFKGKSHTDKTKKILSEAATKRTGELNSFYGKSHSKEVKDALSLKAKARLKDKTKHPSYKKETFVFYNPKEDIVLSMCRTDFYNYLVNKTGSASRGNITGLINKSLKTYKGYGIRF